MDDKDGIRLYQSVECQRLHANLFLTMVNNLNALGSNSIPLALIVVSLPSHQITRQQVKDFETRGKFLSREVIKNQLPPCHH